MRKLLAALPVCLAWFSFCSSPTVAAPDFDKEVRPILESQCLRCHGSGKEKGGLRMHEKDLFFKGGDSGPLVELGEPAHISSLIDRITLPPEDDEIMPQEAEPLSEEEIAVLTAWVESGAEWPEGVRLKPRKKKLITDKIPETAPASIGEIAATIDSLIDGENAKRNPVKAGQIDDLAFLRRATVDLIGRIPTLVEIQAYQKWPEAQRREKLIDKLIADPRFTDRWSVFLADMLRVRSNVQGGRQLMAWLHTSLDEGMPWDKMAHELISANGRPSDNPAVGFVLNDGADPMEMAGAVSQIFLGVRMQCAQCHDHPFDDWGQMDFYELASFFGKTERRENRFSRTVYTTETDEMAVMWPPEREQPPSRSPVKPRFPFELVTYENKPHFLTRFEELRAGSGAVSGEADTAEVDLDDLDALLDLDAGLGEADESFDILGEAKKAGEDLNVKGDLYKPSELRADLAGKITHPRNPYFARAFANRVWAELNGRGFVMPLDNFSEYQANSHPQTLEFIGREFTASGFDIRHLVRMIVLTDTYSRDHLQESVGAVAMENAEKSFTISPTRRMLSESLYDSIVVAGHLEQKKWRAGENVRTISKQIRVPIRPDGSMGADGDVAPASTDASMAMMSPGMAMAANNMSSAGAGYDLESSIEIDFKKVLSDAKDQAKEIDSMRQMADAKVAEEERIRMEMEARRRGPNRYLLKTIQEEVDDNPSFNSTLRMASPAPADHFLRVFGQPSRDGLGEFRDHSTSLRQQLMMLNGKATHEASRVGTLEPLYRLLAGDNPDVDQAIRTAYLETLTRQPSAEELADARFILTDGVEPIDGMSDLRWAIFNSHEFRFLP